MKNNPETMQSPEILEDLQRFISTGAPIDDETKEQLLHLQEEERAGVLSANIDAAETETEGQLLRVNILNLILQGDKQLLSRMHSSPKPKGKRSRDGRDGFHNNPFDDGRSSSSTLGKWLASDGR